MQALIVRITPVRAGTIVRFESGESPSGAVVLTSRLDGTTFGGVLVDTTQADGRVSVRVKLGSRAGTAHLRIIVPEAGLVESATYTIFPGQASAVHLAPHDTTLLVNGSFSVRGGATDRFGNERHDPVVLTAENPSLTITGRVVTMLQSGQGRVLGRVGSLSDTIFVGVVPSGTVSAVFNGVRIFRTDGTQSILLSSGFFPGLGADWSPDGQTLAFDKLDGGAIRVMALDGTVRILTRGVGTEMYPKFSADGQWLYYSANIGAWQIRRVRTDGTGDETVVGVLGNEVAPAPSPDGTRMAYVLAGPDEIRIRTLATGAMTILTANGHSPAWSPNGELIAYNATGSGREIYVINPAGTGKRRVSAPGVSYWLGIDWSPDSRFLIARSERGTIDLIEVATGATFTLSFGSADWGAPAWKQ